MEALKWALIGVSLPIIGWLVLRTQRSAHRLNERIDEYHREQEELERSGKAGPVNPYEQMAELFAPKEEKESDR